jgi:hypothetical protein
MDRGPRDMPVSEYFRRKGGCRERRRPETLA